jgi:Mg-chelatase subunit ChlD
MSKIKAEYIFFLDRSGSMSGERIRKATQSLIIFLKSLPQDSFFNVISFGNDSELLFPSSQKYTKEIIQQSVDRIQVMEADLGGT